MFGDTPLIMVEDATSLARVCEHLAQQPVIGVDTESDSFHHYQEKVCLIQLSGRDSDYIVDPLQVPDLAPLKDIFEDGRIQKILHGGDYDIVCMKRDFDIALHNIFDTMIASQFLAFPRFGLADLVRRYFGVKLDKKYQRHDWSRRPLLDEHIQYARGDTHWLLAVAEVLEYRLKQAGRLDAAREEWAVLELREWSGRTAHPSDFLRLKKSGTLPPEGKRVLRCLWDYREAQAEMMDRPSFKVMPGDLLVELARHKPEDLNELARWVRADSSLYRRHGAALLAAVKAGLADDRPIPGRPARDDRKSHKPAGRRDDQLLGRLKAWRNSIVDREHIAPVVVANNQLLKAIASAAPQDLDALRAVDGIRNWQVATYGAQILDLTAESANSKGTPPAKKGRRRRHRQSSPTGEAQGE